MASKARVFVGIPTLNRPQYVREAINSVLAQTFQDFRVVVSDNVSTDDVVESVASFVRQLDDPRVRFHRQPRNEGEYGQGRFFFREVSDEEFFVILHDDDVLKPEYLEKAVRKLEVHSSLVWFVANVFVIDAEGVVSPAGTRSYRSRVAATGRGEGVIDCLATITTGLTPISGTFFRTSALRASGFVDEDCHGNYPFEFNVLLRLAERGGKAWFCPDELLGLRIHTESARNYARLLDNPDMIENTIRLVERRRFSGANERRRRAVLGRFYRARAVLCVKHGGRGYRQDMVRALRTNPWSIRSWAFFPLAFLAPGLARAVLPPPPEVWFSPRPGDGEAARQPLPAAEDARHERPPVRARG